MLIDDSIANLNFDELITLSELLIKRPVSENFSPINRLIFQFTKEKKNKYLESFNRVFNIDIDFNNYIENNYSSIKVKNYKIGGWYYKMFLDGGLIPESSGIYIDEHSIILNMFTLEYLIYIMNQKVTDENKERLKHVFKNFEELFLVNEIFKKDNNSTLNEIEEYLSKINNFIEHGDLSMPLEWQLELL